MNIYTEEIIKKDTKFSFDDYEMHIKIEGLNKIIEENVLLSVALKSLPETELNNLIQQIMIDYLRNKKE